MSSIPTPSPSASASTPRRARRSATSTPAPTPRSAAPSAPTTRPTSRSRLARKLGKPPREVAAAIVASSTLDDVFEKVEVAGPGLPQPHAARRLPRARCSRACGGRRAPRRRARRRRPRRSSSTTRRRTSPRRCTSATSAARSSATRSRACSRRSATASSGRTTSATGARRSACSSSTCSTTGASGGRRAAWRPRRLLPGGAREVRRRPGFAERARRRVVLLQGGDAETLALWRRLVDESRRATSRRVYERARRDAAARRRRRRELLQPVARRTSSPSSQRKGLAARATARSASSRPASRARTASRCRSSCASRTAATATRRPTSPPSATARATLGATRLLYVVGAPQQQHLAMVFAAARLAGWLAAAARAEHVAFGSVLGADKKMFKTRARRHGEARRRCSTRPSRAPPQVIAEKNPDLDRREHGAHRARRRHRRGEVRRPLERSHQGLRLRLGPHARVRGQHGAVPAVRARAHPLDLPQGRPSARRRRRGAIAIEAPAERALALALLALRGAVERVARALQPHRLCTYLFDLATRSRRSTRPAPCSRPRAPTRASRLALCDLTARMLARGLDLLGIDAPERM